MEDKSKKLWFKRKKYGWGWTPATLSGWLVLGCYVAALVYILSDFPRDAEIKSYLFMNFMPRFIILTIILIYICYKKGEKPRWSWGDDKDEV